MSTREPRPGSCVTCQTSQAIYHPGHPRCQLGRDPLVPHVGTSDTVRLPRKADQRTHYSMMRAPEEVRDPQHPSSGVIFYKKRKAAKDALSLVFSVSYISFRLRTTFSSAKCHNTTEHSLPYPETRGLLGLRFISQNLIVVFRSKLAMHDQKSCLLSLQEV
jgi:hypothetical protein